MFKSTHEGGTVRYMIWHVLFGWALWLATHGPRRSAPEGELGDRLALPLARRMMRLAQVFYVEPVDY